MTQKNLLLVRALTAMNDLESLKTLITGLNAGESPQKNNVAGFSMLIQYFASNKLDQALLEKSKGMIDADPAQVEVNPTLMCLLSYYLLAEGDYNTLLKLVNKSKNPEYLTLKLVAQLKIDRPDLA